MNWGAKIVIGMGIFMSFIVVLIVLMFRSETDALVENDYYEKGLKYNSAYALKEQVIKDQAAPEIKLAADSMIIKFKTQASGSLTLMRTADKHLDKNLRFETDSLRELSLATGPLSKGQWRLILQWSNSAGTIYLDEREVMLR
ncbi:MAG: FixH family protein [Bacteroidota bacterium]